MGRVSNRNCSVSGTAREIGCPGKANMTVNGFAPSVIATPLWEQLEKDVMAIIASQHLVQEFSSGILRGRAVQPEDIARTTTFLASPESDYVTGQFTMIDGGMVSELDAASMPRILEPGPIGGAPVDPRSTLVNWCNIEARSQ